MYLTFILFILILECLYIICNWSAYVLFKPYSPIFPTVAIPSYSLPSIRRQIPPVAAITSPANDQSVSGTTSIQIDATDNTRVSRVSVFMRSQGSTAQGTLVGSAISRPFVISWNTSRVPNNADLELVAIAEDGAGNKGESTPVRFRTNNANVPVLVYLVAYTLPPNGTAPSNSKPDVASIRGVSNTSLGLVNPALVVPPEGTTLASVAKAKSALQTRASSPRAPLSNRSTVIEWAWQPLGSADGYGTYLASNLELQSFSSLHQNPQDLAMPLDTVRLSWLAWT